MRYGLVGYKGKMGKELQQVFLEDGHELVVKVDVNEREITARPDVILDFSSPSALQTTISLAKEFNCAVVVGTTGLSQQQLQELKMLGEIVPVVYSANFSIGIDLVKRILAFIKDQLEGWDIWILEAHHNQKKDAPSGTALALKNIIGKDVPTLSIRAGGIPGDHTVILANSGEVVEIHHRAISRRTFALGALKAAKFAVNASRGFYSFSEVLDQIHK
ncbi:4-hydroxy-tetrahydrodipicolinate reductase [Pseudothermotoga thermarum]|uniref:4-hydroxy-tetrahydrodipicolinate reductase n=1 Tax=Pseudothermotoga thermarum DSM 5069 TaxID=688269 RepID=F7YU94_9THEM|nr:dihydrodipicolinate reductase C-terminal domain-containing protein [Pseudothermotoga thermarum]AEH50194.1 dihydrodipicolinate reductase [Pseudothermotoga thermarum DSM 5069]